MRTSSAITRRRPPAFISTLAALLLAGVLLLGLGAAHAAPGNSTPPVITQVEADFDTNELSILGLDLRANQPTVTLGQTALVVTSWTSTLVVAQLPAVSPASYLVTLSYGTKATDSAIFDATLGAVGPQGPVGPQGETGAPGTNGTNGAPGA